MVREEANDWVEAIRDGSIIINGNSATIKELIDEIYNDFEAEKQEIADKLLEMSIKYSDSVDNAIELKTIVDDFEKQLLKKDIEIAKLEGMLKAMKKEVFRLHPDDCNCMTCEEQRND